MEEKIRQRVACEERAFRIVQKLAENTVSGDYLKDVAAYIDQSHYDDIVEERSIALLCGYPICEKQLTKVSKQKYRICTKTNKVFDITDSKRYCSPRCYKSSQYYQNQVPTSPVWTRLDERKPTIQLLSNTDKVKLLQGEVVLQDPRVLIKEELNLLDTEDRTEDESKGNPESVQSKDEETELPELFPSEPSTSASQSEHNHAPESIIDAKEIYGLDQNQQAVTSSALHKDTMTQSVTTGGHYSERLSQPYCQRVPDHQSQGYVNRATYYGYDQKQQALKAALNKEIVNGDLRNKFNKTEANTGIGRSKNGSKHGFVDSPYGLGQMSQAVSTSVNKSNVTDNLHKHHKSSVHSDNIRTDVTSALRIETDAGNVTSSNQTYQNKVDRLMDLLDKRDALKQNLETNKQKLECSLQKYSDLSNKVDTTASKSISKSNNDISNSTPHQSSTESKASPKSVKSCQSSRVLENISQASSQQNHSVIDSDDELDEDDDDELQPPNPTNVTSQMADLSLADRTSVTTASVTPLALIRKILTEWTTPDTVEYLKGVKAAQSGDEKTQQKYAALNRKVESQIRQYAHLLDGEDSKPAPSKPMPSMSDLMTDPYSKKVAGFYSPQPPRVKQGVKSHVVEPIQQGHEGRKKKLFDHELEEPSVYNPSEYITEKDVCLPYIDSQSQVGLRRRIVLDKLNTVLTDMLGVMRLSMRDISAELRATVHTFRFTSENIVLKPAEWTLMGYCVLKMLSLKVKTLKRSLKKDHSVQFFNAVLLSFGVTQSQVTAMLDQILT